jgi:putative transposase
MATTTGRRGGVKRQDLDAGDEAREIVRDQLEELARQGARDLLMAALQDERDAYLGRGRYERSGDAARSDDEGDAPRPFRGYRNGRTPHRLTLGCGTVQLDVPRVRDIPAGQEPFASKIVRKYQRRSDTIDETFMKLFIEGLATRDFEPALRLLVGERAPLSPSTISRLTQKFKTAYVAFDRQDLSDRKYVYIWCDGIYLKAGLGTEKACLMVLIGADTEGKKHLLALREGYRESTASWGELLKDCRRRRLNQPACWIGDGALGLWAAIDEQSPASAQQRCTNHKTMNVIDKLPQAEKPEAVKRVRAIWQADSEQAARNLAAKLITDFRVAGYDRAAACLADDLDRCLTFYRFPEAHWSHLRTTNVVESPFAGVRLRTNAAKRFKKTKSGVCLVHQVLLRLSQTWRRLKSAHLCSQVELPEMTKTAKKAKTQAA